MAKGHLLFNLPSVICPPPSTNRHPSSAICHLFPVLAYFYNMKVAVFRKEHFNAAHRLNNPTWDAAKNSEIFGKCNYPNYHGHNYDLIVKVIGEVDAATGYVIDLKVLSDIIWEKALDKFDHKNFNLDTEEFKDLNPSAENIAVVIYNLIRPHIDADKEIKITLYETPRNFVEYPV